VPGKRGRDTERLKREMGNWASVVALEKAHRRPVTLVPRPKDRREHLGEATKKNPKKGTGCNLA